MSTASLTAMTYYDSAKSITITRRRALKELALHGVTDLGIADFFTDLGDHESYSAQSVLEWLGY